MEFLLLLKCSNCYILITTLTLAAFATMKGSKDNLKSRNREDNTKTKPQSPVASNDTGYFHQFLISVTDTFVGSVYQHLHYDHGCIGK